MKKAAIILAIVLLAGCNKAYMESVDKVELTLDLGCAPLTRADSPLIPDVENLIYDVWILQYDNMGLLIDAGTSHARTTDQGSLTATVTTTLAIGNGCTICVLANLDREDSRASRVWPQTLNEFKTSTSVVDLAEDVKAANDGTLKDMPMFGYWEGDIDVKTNNIQVSLGRMLTRINLVINNQTSSACHITSFSNVSHKCYVFPNIMHNPLPEDAYEDVTIGKQVAAGATAEMYFYMAPNFTSGAENATRLNIGDKQVILSNGAPDSPVRDYNLYHNSNYTFTINLK